jgi:hypothetical protein
MPNCGSGLINRSHSVLGICISRSEAAPGKNGSRMDMPALSQLGDA